MTIFIRWEPFRELNSLQSEMSRLMNGLLEGNDRGPRSWAPALDVWETPTEVVYAFDLPGIPEDQIHIEVKDENLTVSAERTKIEETDENGFYRFERRYGTFARAVGLPQGADQDKHLCSLREWRPRGARAEARRTEAEENRLVEDDRGLGPQAGALTEMRGAVHRPLAVWWAESDLIIQSLVAAAVFEPIRLDSKHLSEFERRARGEISISVLAKGKDMGIIAFIILGLLAGMIAKALMPGDDPGGWIVTAIIGVAGALLGGFLAGALFDADPMDEFFDISSWLTAIVGSIILLVIYRLVVDRRGGGRSVPNYAHGAGPGANRGLAVSGRLSLRRARAASRVEHGHRRDRRRDIQGHESARARRCPPGRVRARSRIPHGCRPDEAVPEPADPDGEDSGVQAAHRARRSSPPLPLLAVRLPGARRRLQRPASGDE